MDAWGISQLPDEIMVHILKRLPVKLLLRLKCVCKRCKNLINTTFFIEQHLHHSRPLLLLQWNYSCIPRYLLMLNYERELFEFQPWVLAESFLEADVVGCHNGLLCVDLGFTHGYYGHAKILPPFLLWNPATRKATKAPKQVARAAAGKPGFGFNSINNDYNIVTFYSHPADRLNIGAELYSLTTNSWKQIHTVVLRGVTIRDKPVSIDGSICWLGSKHANDHGGLDEHTLVSFDLDTELFTLTPLPVEVASEIGFLTHACLAVYEKKIALLFTSFYECIDLWVMGEGAALREGLGWVKKCTIIWHHTIVPEGIWLNQIVCQAASHYEPRVEATVLYLIDISSHKVEVFTTHTCGRHLSLAFNYAESLVHLDNINNP